MYVYYVYTAILCMQDNCSIYTQKRTDNNIATFWLNFLLCVFSAVRVQPLSIV